MPPVLALSPVLLENVLTSQIPKNRNECKFHHILTYLKPLMYQNFKLSNVQ